MAKLKSSVSTKSADLVVSSQPSRMSSRLVCIADRDIHACEISPEGDMVAAALANGQVFLFELQSGVTTYKLAAPFKEKLPATAVRFRKPKVPVDSWLQNILLVAYSSGHVQQWHISTGKVLSSLREDRQTLSACYSPDIATFATCGSDSKILLYDTTTSANIRAMETSSSLNQMDGHMSRVFSVRYHPGDPHLLVSAGWDDTVQFWDTRKENAIRHFSGPHICGDSIDIDPVSLNIATGSWRYHTPLEIWDFQSGKLIMPVTSCMDTKIYSTCWADEGVVMVGGSQKNIAQLIDIKSDTVMSELVDLPCGVYSTHHNIPTNTCAVAAGNKVHVCPLFEQRPMSRMVSERK